MSFQEKEVRECIGCGQPLRHKQYKYCSNLCQRNYQYERYIEEWKAGEVLGLQRMGVVSKHIKRYLRDKYSDQCCLCGWAEVNPKTGLVPLVADHIDGNWRNNTEGNLRLICPNCDALSPTYAALNIGYGRGERVLSKRARAARSLT
jgi:hypothetical protein